MIGFEEMPDDSADIAKIAIDFPKLVDDTAPSDHVDIRFADVNRRCVTLSSVAAEKTGSH